MVSPKAIEIANRNYHRFHEAGWASLDHPLHQHHRDRVRRQKVSILATELRRRSDAATASGAEKKPVSDMDKRPVDSSSTSSFSSSHPLSYDIIQWHCPLSTIANHLKPSCPGRARVWNRFNVEFKIYDRNMWNTYPGRIYGIYTLVEYMPGTMEYIPSLNICPEYIEYT